MCYNAAYIKKRIKKEAERQGKTLDDAVLPNDWHYVSAFTHPSIPVITSSMPELVQSYTWGLIPEWVQDSEAALEMQRITPNARCESIFEKPSFRDAATNGQTCLIMSTGFFEYHHRGTKKYPYYISSKNEDVTYLAGLYSHWNDQKTVAILTTKANGLMGDIHNNPTALERGGPRMPVIISGDKIGDWLSPTLTTEELKNFFTPYDSNLMVAYTVPPLTGKRGVGNTESATKFLDYPELHSLF